MEFGKKERDLLIGLIGVVMAILVWFLVASPYNEKTAAMEAENEALKPKVEEYQAVASRITDYQEGMANLEVEKNQIIEKFPSDIIRTDEIMFWANLDKEFPGQILVKDLTMSEAEEIIAESDATPVVAEVQYDEEGNPIVTQDDIVNSSAGTSTVALYKLPLNITFDSTYEGLKDIWQYLDMQSDKNGLQAMQVEFDSATGNLTGSFDVNLYYMVGTNKEHIATFIPSSITGVPDLFRTTGVGLDSPEAAEGEEEEAE